MLLRLFKNNLALNRYSEYPRNTLLGDIEDGRCNTFITQGKRQAELMLIESQRYNGFLCRPTVGIAGFLTRFCSWEIFSQPNFPRLDIFICNMSSSGSHLREVL